MVNEKKNWNTKNRYVDNNNIKKVKNEMSSSGKVYTITYGDVAENHARMQKIGCLHETGYSVEKLRSVQEKLEGYGLETEMIDSAGT